MLKPTKLNPGDTVAAITLSWGGAGLLPHRYEAGKRQFEAEFGLRVAETPHALRDPDWISRNPRARADDLMQAFADPTIKAIISMIGGDDSMRLLPYLDLEIIRANPKIFMGYSDTLVSHFACWKAGLISYYGPSFMAGFAENGGIFPYMADSVRRTLFSTEPIGELKPNQDGWTVEYLDWENPDNQTQKRKLNPNSGWRWLQGQGIHRGRLVGGCLEVMDWLRGTDYFPPLSDWQSAILFIETSEEAPTPDQVKHMLRPLGAMGILRQLAGIWVGRPGGGIPPERFPEYDQAILDIVVEEEGLSNLPIVTNMDFGHTDPMMVIPYGVQAEMNCDTRKITLLESAVTD
ncbi:MAG: LD-carboxypeptidase [Chloroflexi bacterium]|nr:LD-carboxypeptidase [Chloroflexota bacterium]MCC6897095.1 LD-carboxypeptidase [Anaerolineae bacterium]